MKSSFYFLTNGELIKRDNTLEFVDEEKNRTYLPIFQVNDLYIMSTVKITCDLLKLLSKNGITIHYFDKYEYYLGSFYPVVNNNLNGNILVKQVINFSNIETRLKLSKEVIIACFKNMRRVVKNHFKDMPDKIQDTLTIFEKNTNKIYLCNTINEIMLVEASMHKTYYAVWNEIFVDKNIVIVKREKRANSDLINSLISFINSLLYALIVSEIYKTSLNVTISFLHEPSQSRVSLAYDIAEIFRPILVDRLIFYLVNKKIINLEDFDITINRLKESAVKKILYH